MNDRVFVGNDPVNAVDPWGLAPPGTNWFTWGLIRGGVGTVAGVPLTIGQGIGLFSPSELNTGENDWIKDQQFLREYGPIIEELERIHQEYARMIEYMGGYPCDSK